MISSSLAKSLGVAAVLAAGALSATHTAGAQTAHAAVVGRPLETRESLLAQARVADSVRDEDRARLLRTRLQNGDFRDGDRVVLIMESPIVDASGRPDTLVVTTGNVLDFPVFDDVPLQGVLRSELHALLTQHLTRYYNNPRIRVEPLLQVSVLGAVSRQQFAFVSPSMLLSEVLTLAGLAGNADPSNVTIRRGTQTIWQKDDVRDALRDGFSVDRMHLMAGDQILVGERRERNWIAILQLTLATTALILTIARQWK